MWIVFHLLITLQLMVSLGNAQPINTTSVTKASTKDGEFNLNNINFACLYSTFLACLRQKARNRGHNMADVSASLFLPDARFSFFSKISAGNVSSLSEVLLKKFNEA